ncbi:MAG TPA: hypothetical protein VFO79_11080, partial [Xanthomonadales bacterium]|nr:hypothetical protein [Xanthomonadales bacterium]
NDAPSFTVLGNRTHPAGTIGAQTVPGFVTGTNFGPGEAAQAVLDYIVVQNGGPAGVVTSIDIANDGTLSYSLSGAPGTVTIDATLQDTGGVANGGDDTSNVVSFTIAVAAAVSADLSITKTDGTANAVLGQSVAYTIDVANAGPQAVTGARVVDTVPAELVGATWTCTPTPPATCANASGTGSIDEPLTLAAGQAVRYVLTGTVGGSVGGTLVNTASVNAPVGTPDPVGANNSATDTDAIVPDGVFANGFEN